MSDLTSRPMREQVYADPRPKEYFDQFHERARTREPNWVYEATRMVTSLYGYTLLRVRSISSEKVPGRGAVILAPNHFSFMDHFLMGCYIRRKVRFMAKSQLFSFPMRYIYSPGGVFPVRRGARDEETFITAETILARGGAITMYCEGGRSRTGKMATEAKRGIGRLALETGAPIVPIAIYGSSRIRNWKRLRFPKVTVQYGDAIRWERIENPTREQQQAVADEDPHFGDPRPLRGTGGARPQGRAGTRARGASLRASLRSRRSAVVVPVRELLRAGLLDGIAMLVLGASPGRTPPLGTGPSRKATGEGWARRCSSRHPRRESRRPTVSTCWSWTAPRCSPRAGCARAWRAPGRRRRRS